MNADDFVANLVGTIGGSDAYHDPSEVHADDARTCHRATSQPQPGQDIELTEGSGTNLDDDLALAQLGFSDLLEFEAVETFLPRVDGPEVSDSREFRSFGSEVQRKIRLDETGDIDFHPTPSVLALLGRST
jgi:hypothetical protein